MSHGLRIVAVVVAAVFAIGLAGNAPSGQGRSDLALDALESSPHMPGEVIVQYHPFASERAKGRALGRVAAAREEVLVAAHSRTDAKGDLELVRLPPGLGIAEAVRALEGDPSVEFAEPNWVYFHTATSNDPYYTNGSLWGMYGDTTSPTNQYGSQAAEAWAPGNTGSDDVYVGIIDEGYMYTHEDLAANAGTNPGETAGNGIDDDGNGYVDDVYGWDFDRNDNTVFHGTADAHGTHVAGTIGAVGGNGKGVAGVCWKVKLLNAKFLGKRGGTTANAIRAVDYFTDLKTRHGLNIVATNNSWGGGGFSQGLQDAIERANGAGILFVAAAGNSGVNIDPDSTTFYPAEYPNSNIIAVASITSTGALSSFSNYGATKVDLGAPGSAIWSTVPVNSKGKVVSGYASYSGTSMATPHVTGAAALYAATHPGETAGQIKDAILLSAVATASLSGKCVTGERLNVSGF
jgi:subtilisin family serine protease